MFIAVFIYSMPGYSVSIKERMLYSSCKNSVVEVLEKVYSIIINKKIEVDSGAELTEEYLLVSKTISINYIGFPTLYYRESSILSRI